ncbi:MAG: (2Fe-2S)-binding protein [Alphaproteobacteria bacterium]
METIRLSVNGEPEELEVDVRATLLDLARDTLGLTGAKNGCGQGQCGACTMLVDGRRINACLALAVAHDGSRVVTVEGLANDGAPNRLQQAFVAHDALQCGFCTPGQICAATGLLEEVAREEPSLADDGHGGLSAAAVRERMSGNLCRCGAYNNIVAAILDAGTAQ